jgi:hypothetical protein
MLENFMNMNESLLSGGAEAVRGMWKAPAEDVEGNYLFKVPQNIAQSAMMHLAYGVAALKPRAASYMRSMGLSEESADRVSQNFLSILAGLLITQGLGCKTEEPIKGTGLPEQELDADNLQKKSVFSDLLKTLMPTLITMCTDDSERTERSAEAVSHTHFDRLLVLARLCQVGVVTKDGVAPTITQLTESLLAWSLLPSFPKAVS